MPVTITKTVYTFGELLQANEKKKKVSDLAVGKARQWLQEGVTDDHWHEFLLGDWKTALGSVGFLDAEINFSGFHSQGDGASFTSAVDLETLIRFMSNPPEASNGVWVNNGKEVWGPWIVHKAGGVRSNKKFGVLLRAIDKCNMKVERKSHHYSHEKTCGLDADCLASGKVTEATWKDFVEAVEELRKDLCRAIYKDLNGEYEFLSSDEQLIQSSEANDWTFDESGHRDTGVRESETTLGKLRELVDRVAEKQGTDQRGALRDIVTEAQHLAEENGWDWDHLLDGAQEVFEVEKVLGN